MNFFKQTKLTVTEKVFIYAIFSLAACWLLLFIASGGQQQKEIVFTKGKDFIMDFYNTIKFTEERSPYLSEYLSRYNRIYPPLIYMLLYPLSFLTADHGGLPPHISAFTITFLYILFTLAFSVPFYWIIYNIKTGGKKIQTAVIATFIISSVSIYSLERGNFIYIAIIFSIFFLFYYKHKNSRISETAIILLSIAASIKIYPAIFGILLIYEKHYGKFARLILYSCLLFFLPFLFFKEGFTNFIYLLENLKLFTKLYSNQLMYHNIGIIPAINFIFYIIKGKIYPLPLNLFMFFNGILMILSLISAYFQKQTWKKLTLIIGASTLLQFNSGFYCGLYYFLPITYFLNTKKFNFKIGFYLAMFIIFLNPYQIYKGHLSISSFLSNIAILTVFLTLTAEGLWKGMQKRMPTNQL